MEGLDVDWFCRCRFCGRVLTGSLEVTVCQCEQYRCQVCAEKQLPEYCETCSSQYQPRPDLIQKFTQLYKGILNFYRWNCSKPQEAYGPIQELIQRFREGIAKPLEADQGAALIQQAAETPPMQAYEAQPTDAPEYSEPREQFFVVMCRHCGGTLGAKGRCQNCHKVTLEQVGFDHQAFLANKWQCPQCPFRNVHNSDRCVNCGHFKAAFA